MQWRLCFNDNRAHGCLCEIFKDCLWVLWLKSVLNKRGHEFEFRARPRTLSSLSKRMTRMSWYSVSLSRMMSGSVTVEESSWLLLDWGRLDCLKDRKEERECPSYKCMMTTNWILCLKARCRKGVERQRAVLTRPPAGGKRPLQRHLSASEKKEESQLITLWSTYITV